MIKFSNPNPTKEYYAHNYKEIVEHYIFHHFCGFYALAVQKDHPQLILPPIPGRNVQLKGKPVVFIDPSQFMPEITEEQIGGVGEYFFVREAGLELKDFLIETPYRGQTQ